VPPPARPDLPRRAPTRRPPRRSRPIVLAAVAILCSALVGVLFVQPPTPTASSTTPASTPRAAPSPSAGAPPLRAPQAAQPVTPSAERRGLDPALGAALRSATADAARDGVQLQVTSGWRSPEHQAELLREAIAQYGSAAEAARWVATPETSPHVSGDAVDVGPAAAASWLSRHGAAHGLCQIYANEPWHFELRPAAGGCPPTYADPTQDPRMRR
jgi:LAS superfamily LD-carboxypeptidase LdcB